MIELGHHMLRTNASCAFPRCGTTGGKETKAHAVVSEIKILVMRLTITQWAQLDEAFQYISSM